MPTIGVAHLRPTIGESLGSSPALAMRTLPTANEQPFALRLKLAHLAVQDVDDGRVLIRLRQRALGVTA